MIVYLSVSGGIGFMGNLVDVVGHSAELPYVVHQLRSYALFNDTGMNALAGVFALVNTRFMRLGLEGIVLV